MAAEEGKRGRPWKFWVEMGFWIVAGVAVLAWLGALLYALFLM